MERKSILIITHEDISHAHGATLVAMAQSHCAISTVSVNQIIANEDILRGHKHTTVMIPEELKEKAALEHIHNIVHKAAEFTILHHGYDAKERIVYY